MIWAISAEARYCKNSLRAEKKKFITMPVRTRVLVESPAACPGRRWPGNPQGKQEGQGRRPRPLEAEEGEPHRDGNGRPKLAPAVMPKV